MADIALEIDPRDIRPGAGIRGGVSVSYPGRYDGVVINSQILDSNEHVTYLSYCGRDASRALSRLFIPAGAMEGGRASFEAVIEFVPEREHEVKFRASIIEQHKEVDSAVVFAGYSA